MRWLQKIVRNGSSSQVTLPRQLMAWCDFVTGQPVIIEALEDKSIRVRAVKPDELSPKRPSAIFLGLEPPAAR